MVERRRVLAGVAALALQTPVTGCLQRVTPSESPQGTASLPTRLWFEAVSEPEGDVDPIVYGDLPSGERAIVETALEDGEYAVDSESTSPPLESLRDRIERRADGGLEVYLKRGESYYRVGFAAGDYVVAHPSQ